ncbi:MAG TPA: hypothetical protein VF017_18320 [Thermoanaerobaculia bacterium]|nr:hypothetical protein [Thermoanaerobaculia bacterium]
MATAQAPASLNVGSAFAEPVFAYPRFVPEIQQALFHALQGFELDLASLSGSAASSRPSDWLVSAGFLDQRGITRVGYHGFDVTFWYPAWGEVELFREVVEAVESEVLASLPACRVGKRTFLFQAQVAKPLPSVLAQEGPEELVGRASEILGPLKERGLLVRFGGRSGEPTSRVWLEASQESAGWSYLSLESQHTSLSQRLGDDLAAFTARLKALSGLFGWEDENE